jgi:rubredoxin
VKTGKENKSKTKVRCPLCGVEYDPEEAESACRGCPLKAGCDLIKCPNCGFETIAE